MTIGGTDIKTEYGLRLLKLENWYGLPARKNVLRDPAFGANDIKYVVRKPKVTLLGKYDSQNDLAIAVEAFRDWLKHDLIQAVVITQHGISFNGVFDNGMKTTVKRNYVTIELTITVAE